jgi:hypothetical protein
MSCGVLNGDVAMPVHLNANKIYPAAQNDAMVAHAVIDEIPTTWFGVGVDLPTLSALAGRNVKIERAAAVYADFIAAIERAATARVEVVPPAAGTMIMLTREDLRSSAGAGE